MSEHPAETPQQTVHLLTYWTQRYVMILLALLVLVGLAAGLWLRTNAYEQSWQLLEMRAHHIADGYAQLPDDTLQPLGTYVAKELRNSRYVAQVFERNGNQQTILPKGLGKDSPAPPPPPASVRERVLQGEFVKEKAGDEPLQWLRVGVTLQTRTGTDALFLAAVDDDILPHYVQLYGPLALLVATCGLAGWLVIYFLLRKLTQHLLAQGSYDHVLPRHVRELARVSHELRTPITSIRGMIQAVKNKVVTHEEAEEFLSISLEETKRLQKMVEELLSLSSFEAGATPPVEVMLIDLHELSAEVVRQVQLLPAFAKLDLELQAEAPALRAIADSGMLRQILLNLLSNSAAACAPGGQVILRLSEAEDRIALDVEDDGRGIPEEDQPFIFERFYRGQSGIRKSGGLGIGLTISRHLARAMEGDLLLLHSEPGCTVFRLLLPRP